LPLQITAALAVKKIMERERLSGTLLVWPGVAEELLGGKAYLVRAGVFKCVDVCLFAHVGDTLTVRWGEASNTTGLVSIEYRSEKVLTQRPWRGRSAPMPWS
jgi:aminobenzoyl-glutamate utilization protein B